MDLYNAYGYCLIPKGVYLYRCADNTEIRECMFFGLDPLVAGCFQDLNDPSIHIWQTIEPIKILFMVSYIDSQARAESAIVEIYESYFPGREKVNDMEIKSYNRTLRDALISKLIDDGIGGWLSSLENAQQLEICLFADRIRQEKRIKFVSSQSDNAPHPITSLKKIKIYPSDRFYKLSEEPLKFQLYPKYKQRIRSILKEELESTDDINYIKNFWYTLRIKLKI